MKLLFVSVLGKMVEMGYNMTDITESLSETLYDEICATYMLLGSTNDFKNNNFDHPLSSSLSPVNPADNSLPMTPTIVTSTKGESTGGYKYSPSSKTHSSSNAGHSATKKISAPGVPTSVSTLSSTSPPPLSLSLSPSLPLSPSLSLSLPPSLSLSPSLSLPPFLSLSLSPSLSLSLPPSPLPLPLSPSLLIIIYNYYYVIAIQN